MSDRLGSGSAGPAWRDPPESTTGIEGGATAGRPLWWHEALIVAVFYALYTTVRDVRGGSPVSAALAYHHATDVIALERWLGIFREATIQSWFVHWRIVVVGLDGFYGTAHFVVTGAALLLLFFKSPTRYRRWRNTLACTTGVALIGFAVFPLMPPRLLPASYHMVDTLQIVGGGWSFDAGLMSKVSNQFAAMPSLHFAWSAWSAFVLFPLLRPRWAKALAVMYPALTLVCVVVTANHYFLDIVGGAVTLAAGYLIGRAFTATAAVRRRPSRRVPGRDQP